MNLWQLQEIARTGIMLCEHRARQLTTTPFLHQEFHGARPSDGIDTGVRGHIYVRDIDQTR